MKVKKGFSLLEVTVCILIMGFTITALLNTLQWGNDNYNEISASWKLRSLYADIRVWLRENITQNNNSALTIEELKSNIKCPKGFQYNELTITKHDNDTYFVKLGIYHDKNQNGKADSDETINRLFCFRRRTA